MYEETAVRATEALQLYGDVLWMILNSNDGAQEFVTEDGSTDLPALWATLERRFAYLREVNVTFRKMEESGVDVAHVDALIGEAERCLTQAEEFLQQVDADGAEEALDSAFKFLDSAMAFMKSLNEGLTAKKVEVFLAKSERRYERLEGDIMDLVDSGSFELEDFNAINQTLEDAHLKNRELKDLLEGGNLSTLKGELEGFKEYSDDVFGILDEGDKELAKDLRKAYKSEVKDSKHEDTNNSKKGTSSDTEASQDQKDSKSLDVAPSDPDPEPEASQEPEEWDPKSLDVAPSDPDPEPEASQEPEEWDPKRLEVEPRD